MNKIKCENCIHSLDDEFECVMDYRIMEEHFTCPLEEIVYDGEYQECLSYEDMEDEKN